LDSRHESLSPSLLILAQVDHACGDIISSVLEQLTAAGAKNVNLVPSLTKKGRPGYLMYVDVPASCLAPIERLLAVELGVTGWRVLAAEHRGPAMESRVLDVSLGLDMPDSTRAVPVKLILDSQTGSRVAHIEHDFCVQLKQELLDSAGVDIPLRVLKARIQSAVTDSIDSAKIECKRDNREKR
jgi:uncharacterized protein (DUF111 family)